MIKLIHKDNEVNIELTLFTSLGSPPKIEIVGKGDLLHHLIDGCFEILEKLAKMESMEYPKNRRSK